MFKKYSLFIFFFLIISCFINVYSLENNDNESDHNELRKLRAIYEEAVNKNNLELIKPYLDENFSIVTFTDKEFNDFDAFKKQWNITRKKMLTGGSYQVELLPDRSLIIDDIAITKGNSKNTIITGKGDNFNFTAYWTAVCRKVDGKWKIIRGHNSLDPFGNPMIKAGFTKTLIKISIVVLLVGFILGWVSRIFYSRLKKKTN